jgi:hypothetical protein
MDQEKVAEETMETDTPGKNEAEYYRSKKCKIYSGKTLEKKTLKKLITVENSEEKT